MIIAQKINLDGLTKSTVHPLARVSRENIPITLVRVDLDEDLKQDIYKTFETFEAWLFSVLRNWEIKLDFLYYLIKNKGSDHDIAFAKNEFNKENKRIESSLKDYLLIIGEEAVTYVEHFIRTYQEKKKNEIMMFYATDEKINTTLKMV